MARIREIAEVCKSKNAGPFDLTVDLVFREREMFDRVKATGTLCSELFSRLYNVPVEDILFTVFDAGLAFKASFPRLVTSGAVGDSDVYGAQQHAPLLDVDIPIETSERRRPGRGSDTMGILQVQRLGYALGAEVTGIDLRRPLSPEVVAEIRQAWLEHIVLCFPNQDLEPEHLAAFGSYFGEADNNEVKQDARLPGLLTVQAVANKPVRVSAEPSNGRARYDKIRGTFWHSDRSFTIRPSTATILVSKALPDVGGNTMFNNMYLAYETLSQTMQSLLEPLSAIHYKRDAYPDFDRKTPEEREAILRIGPVVHPLVRVHPETGRKALYFGAGRTRRFIGMTEEESRPLIAFLASHVTRYEFVYRHVWRLHDLVMWDNRCAMHCAVPDYDPAQLRKMIRVSLLGPQSGIPFTEELEKEALGSRTLVASS